MEVQRKTPGVLDTGGRDEVSKSAIEGLNP